jgi:WD40 repeat protein
MDQDVYGEMAISQNGKIVASSQDRIAKLWDLTTGELLQSFWPTYAGKTQSEPSPRMVKT